MFSDLKTKPKVVGLKQSRRAISSGEAETVYLAEDAGHHIKLEIVSLCRLHSVAVVAVSSMEELGKACGVDVSTAVATILAIPAPDGEQPRF